MKHLCEFFGGPLDGDRTFVDDGADVFRHVVRPGTVQQLAPADSVEQPVVHHYARETAHIFVYAGESSS